MEGLWRCSAIMWLERGELVAVKGGADIEVAKGLRDFYRGLTETQHEKCSLGRLATILATDVALAFFFAKNLPIY
jgi:hypothetical protein